MIICIKISQINPEIDTGLRLCSNTHRVSSHFIGIDPDNADINEINIIAANRNEASELLFLVLNLVSL